MSEPICPIEEDERDCRRAIAYRDIYMQYNPATLDNDAVIRRKDLSIQASHLLDRIGQAVQMSLAQTDCSLPARPLRKSVSITSPLGSNAVASAASSASIARPPPIRSCFELSSSMKHNTNGREKHLQLLRKEIKTELEEVDVETVQLLNELFTQATQPQDLKSATQPFNANRARLEPPRLSEEQKKNYLSVILALHKSVEEMISDCTDHLSGQAERDLKEMERLREEKIKVIEEHIRSMSNQQSWGALATLTRYLTFTATLLISSEISGPASYFLFASGALGLVNAAAIDLSVWEGIAAYFTKSQEVQSKIVRDIDLFLTLCSIGFGFIGGIEAYGAGAFALAKSANRDTTLAKTKDIIIWFTAIFTTISFTGKNWSEKKLNSVQAKLEAVETKLVLLREQFKSKSLQTSHTVKMAQVITEETARILASSEVSLRQ